MRNPFILRSLSLLLFVAIWAFAAAMADSPALPTPKGVMDAFMEGVRTGELPYHLGVTLARLSVSFVLAMTLGSAIGLLLGRHEGCNRFFDSWLLIFLNIPALVTIILCYVWFGLAESAAITAVVLNKLPNVIVTLREGTRNLDRDLLEMAQSYRFGRIKTLLHVVLPQLFPFFMGAARTGLALIWKIILVVELLGRSNGMGYQLHLYFQMFDVAGILAYTMAFIIVMQFIEVIFMKPLDRRAVRWKR